MAFFAHTLTIRAKAYETQVSATQNSGRDTRALVYLYAYQNSFACMLVYLHACTYRCVHARARCDCLLLANVCVPNLRASGSGPEVVNAYRQPIVKWLFFDPKRPGTLRSFLTGLEEVRY